MDYSQLLVDLLTATAQQNASDLHIAVGRRPSIRVDGALIELGQYDITTPEVAEALCMAMLNPLQQEVLKRDRQVDFAYTMGDKARFRVNVYYQRGYLAAALRPTEQLVLVVGIGTLHSIEVYVRAYQLL